MALLSLKALRFAWPGQPTLLDIEAFSLEANERVFLKGPSGSGKSTLLSLLSGVARAQSGSIHLLGQDLSALRPSARDRLRAEQMGFMFQQFNLLPFLSVRDNVMLGCHFSASRKARAKALHGSVEQSASVLLEALKLPRALQQRPAAELSIGQQQRVAAARALIGAPALIIADEPTSALDADSRGAFLELLFSQCQASQAALLLVSHDQALAPFFDRALSLPELNRAARPEEY